GTALETIAMGVSPIAADPAARRLVRHALEIPDDAIVFAAFGRVTPEKRIPAILEALALLRREGLNAWLLIVGEGDDRPGIVAGGVRTPGSVSDAAVGAYLTAADACLCLRWPTALETSASWLRCLAARKATVITDLAHLVDVPALDLTRSGRQPSSPVAVKIDLLDEDRSLLAAMRRLAHDTAL